MVPSDPPSSSVLLEEFFSGRLQGWGLTLGRFGGEKNRFTLQAEGEWNPVSRTLKLYETYFFDDGHQDDLTWKIIKSSGKDYQGFETRIAGSARGIQNDSLFCWKYRRDVPGKDGSSTRLGFNDRFFFHDEHHMTAHASLTLLGVEVATLHAFYQRAA
ncbi:DUF3833 family protein (plasmid) [Peteryoungia desertarenae]|uniref:DUF3833 family protein n=1 Tax=Peteryoungia desertarenae TaxID=1813451 RepID=A0ABX6QSQ8_9HYPH|nr:DUF3833 family protein [Peteryoungia desertarenae]QLF71534.1 DUF3833 family protein [Peteryoungia desertarenae]